MKDIICLNKNLTEKMVGKTISSIDDRAVNVLVINFTDGSSIELEARCALPSLGLYGIFDVED